MADSRRILSYSLCCLFLFCFENLVISNPVQQLYHLPKVVRDMIISNKTETKLHRGDIIPDLPNLLRLPNETTLSVDSENAKGSITLSHIVATGLDALIDDVEVNLVQMKTSAMLKIPAKVWISGDYILDGKVSSGEDETSVSGQGSFTVGVKNLNVLMESRLDVALLSGRVSLANMDLQVAYETISIRADNFALNDEVVDWQSVNTELNENFESVWSQYQEPLVIAVTEGINELISGATIKDLVDVFQKKKTFEQLILSAGTSGKRA